MRDVVTCPVVFHGVAERALHLGHVLVLLHLDEVDDHLAAYVAELELAGDGLRSFHVCLEGHGLEIAFAGDLAGVDIDGHKRFRLVEAQAAARGHEHFAAVNLVELAAKVEALPHGTAGIIVQAHELLLVGEEQGDSVPDAFGHIGVVHPYLRHVVREVVADGAFGEAGLPVHAGRSLHLSGFFADFSPGALQIDEVILERGLSHAGAYRADNDTEVITGIDTVHELAQAGTFLFVADLP